MFNPSTRAAAEDHELSSPPWLSPDPEPELPLPEPELSPPSSISDSGVVGIGSLSTSPLPGPVLEPLTWLEPLPPEPLPADPPDDPLRSSKPPSEPEPWPL
jgi:hypothetical protein